MRAFIIIPVPLLLLIGIVVGGAGSNRASRLNIPDDIETSSVKEQVDFGDRARKAKRYELALQYCVKGENSEDLLTQLKALTCLSWSHRDTGNKDEALKYMNRYKSVEQAQGWDTKTTDKDIAELKKMR
jgi:hypothetical protein